MEGRFNKLANKDNYNRRKLNENKKVKILTLPNGIEVKAYTELSTSGKVFYTLVVEKFYCGYLPKTFQFHTKEKANDFYKKLKDNCNDFSKLDN